MLSVKYRREGAPLHIALLGRSGVGKSSFCNGIRNLSNDAENAAPVGLVETTTEPTAYKLFENVFLWDVPGVNTPSVRREDYCRVIEIDRYDMFLVLSRVRLTEIDIWLTDLVRDRFDKPVFFVRTAIDEELRNQRRDYPKDFRLDFLLEQIRSNSMENLRRTCSKNDLSIYLINTKDKSKYDFPRLIDDIAKRIDDERNNRVLTMIKDDSSRPEQTAQKIVTTWPQIDFLLQFYKRFRR